MTTSSPPVANRSDARAFVVEDDTFSNAMLQSFVAGMGYHVSSAADGAEAISKIIDFDPDIAIVDLDLGDGPNGVDVVTHIQRHAPWTAIVMLTSHSAPDLVSSLPLQPSPFLVYEVKSQIHNAEDLRVALERALEGQGGATRSHSTDTVITTGQAELLRFIAKGLSNDEIARRKGVRPNSVERMVARLYRELGLNQESSTNQRVEAVRRYMTGGINVR